MAKLYETSEEIRDFIENIIGTETTLERYISWRILSNDKQKELIKVAKSSAVTEYFAKMRDSIIIYVNEEVFDRMKPDNVNAVDYRKLVIEDVLSTKYGEDLVHAAETAAFAFDQIKEEEKRKKEEEKEKKAAERAAKKNG